MILFVFQDLSMPEFNSAKNWNHWSCNPKSSRFITALFSHTIKWRSSPKLLLCKFYKRSHTWVQYHQVFQVFCGFQTLQLAHASKWCSLAMFLPNLTWREELGRKNPNKAVGRQWNIKPRPVHTLCFFEGHGWTKRSTSGLGPSSSEGTVSSIWKLNTAAAVLQHHLHVEQNQEPPTIN